MERGREGLECMRHRWSASILISMTVHSEKRAGMCMVSNRKAALRKETRARLKAMSTEEIERKSRDAAHRLLELPKIRETQGGNAFCFLSMEKEIQTMQMIETLQTRFMYDVSVPNILSKEDSLMEALLLPNPFNDQILTTLPKDDWNIPIIHRVTVGEDANVVYPEDIDVVVCPGLIFDETCNRCGQGRGFYDKYLTVIDESRNIVGKGPSFKVAVAFDDQVLPGDERVPSTPMDVQLDCIVTDSRTIYNNPSQS